MRSLTFVDAGRLEWRDQPEPIITGAGQALVCPVAASICGIDYLGGHLDDVALPLFAMCTRGVTCTSPAQTTAPTAPARSPQSRHTRCCRPVGRPSSPGDAVDQALLDPDLKPVAIHDNA